MSANPYIVTPGQIWEDIDPRMGGRQFRIERLENGRAVVVVMRAHRNGYTGKTGGIRSIRLDRFKPTCTGYRLIEDVKG